MSQTYGSDELLSLCAALVDGALEESEAVRVRTLLHADLQAREFYLRFMEVHALLSLDYSGGSIPVAMPGGSSMPRSSLTDPAVGVDVLGTTGMASEAAVRRGPIPSAATLLALAFGGGMVAMLLLFGLASMVVHHDRSAGPERLPLAAPAPGDHQSGSKSAVARLIELDNACWDSVDGSTPKVGDLIRPGPHRLRSGAATIAFRDGVVLSVEGPTDLDVGAEGRVRIKAVEGAAEAARLDNGKDLDHARQSAPNASGPIPPLDLDPAYPALILDSRPIGYWRFTALENGRFANEIAGAPPLVAIGAALAEGDPRGNRYLVLAAAHGEPCLESEPVWELRQTPGHAVELWFLPGASRHASLVGLLPPAGLIPLGQQDRYLHSLLVELTTAQPQSLHKPSSVRLLLRSPLDPFQVTNVYSAQAYVPGRWHHLVAQKRGASAELYVDGILTAGGLQNPGQTPFLCQIVVGRRMSDPTDLNESRAFRGCLDELALYDHPLSGTEIRHHFHAGGAAKAGRQPGLQ